MSEDTFKISKISDSRPGLFWSFHIFWPEILELPLVEIQSLKSLFYTLLSPLQQVFTTLFKYFSFIRGHRGRGSWCGVRCLGFSGTCFFSLDGVISFLDASCYLFFLVVSVHVLDEFWGGFVRNFVRCLSLWVAFGLVQCWLATIFSLSLLGPYGLPSNVGVHFIFSSPLTIKMKRRERKLQMSFYTNM